MLLLLSEPPEDAPAIKPETVESFLRFKRNEPNSPLLDSSTQQPVLDILGNGITCDGAWNTPKMGDIFQASIQDLHIDCHHVGVLKDACEDCCQKVKTICHQGCR